MLVVNPAGDRLFAAYAELLVDHGATTPEQLELRLRPEYPGAAVHARLLSDERSQVWYVYRDGRWVSGDRVDGDHGFGLRSRREGESRGAAERRAAAG